MGEEELTTPVWLHRLRDGGWAGCCSEECALEWGEANRILRNKRPEFVKRDMPSSRPACIACSHCGVLIHIPPGGCQIHSPSYCPGFQWFITTAARYFVIYWSDATNGAEISEDTWQRAEHLAAKHGGMLTGSEIAALILE